MPDDRPESVRGPGLDARDEIAKAFSLPSGKAFDRAKFVIANATPSEVKLLDQGQVELGEVYNKVKARERAAEEVVLVAKLDGEDLGGEILHGDGFKIGPPRASVDLIIVDPPWGIRRAESLSLRGEHRLTSTLEALPDWDDVHGFQTIRRCLRRTRDLLRPGGSFYIFVPARAATIAWDEAKKAGLHPKNYVYWRRTNPTPQGRQNFSNAVDTILYGTKGRPFVWNLGGDAPNIIDAPIAKRPDRHPTEKPAELIRRLVLASSVPGALVCDFMAGSGVLAVVARGEKRRFVVVEADADYIRAIKARLSREGVPGADA